MEKSISEEENFDNWNIKKKEVNLNTKITYPKHREVWYVSIGKNIGFESYGKGSDFKRPVLVLSRIGSMFLITSMTTKGKNNKFYFKLKENTFDINSFITLSQLKTIDKKRFIEKIGKVNTIDFEEIKKESNIYFNSFYNSPIQVWGGSRIYLYT